MVFIHNIYSFKENDNKKGLWKQKLDNYKSSWTLNLHYQLKPKISTCHQDIQHMSYLPKQPWPWVALAPFKDLSFFAKENTFFKLERINEFYTNF